MALPLPFTALQLFPNPRPYNPIPYTLNATFLCLQVLKQHNALPEGVIVDGPKA